MRLCVCFLVAPLAEYLAAGCLCLSIYAVRLIAARGLRNLFSTLNYLKRCTFASDSLLCGRNSSRACGAPSSSAFTLVSLLVPSRLDLLVNRQTNGQTHGRTDGRTVGRMFGRTLPGFSLSCMCMCSFVHSCAFAPASRSDKLNEWLPARNVTSSRFVSMRFASVTTIAFLAIARSLELARSLVLRLAS